MADHTRVKANVQQSSTATKETLLAAVAIEAGQLCYQDSDGELDLCDCSDSTKRTPKGIACNDAAAGQFVTVVKVDSGFTPSYSLNEGEILYMSSSTAGSAGEMTSTLSDVNNSGEAPIVIGIGIGSDQASINCDAPLVSGEVA